MREPLARAEGTDSLRLPCGGCIGCRTARAREWALRCTLEQSEHDAQCWVTLTYADEYLPPTLCLPHLQRYVRSLRKRRGPLRYFAAGEYGERTYRPHYHAILFGVSEQERAVLEEAWPHGFVRVDPLTPAAISYVAGYCSKKIGWRDYERGERIDYSTGEVYEYQPPFVRMSRRPGIGGAARKFRSSWRTHAVHAGSPMPVPRFLHKAWRDTASDEDIRVLEEEKRDRYDVSRLTKVALAAAEAHAVTLHSLKAERRQKL